jgi:hypothetical protein
MAPIDAKQLRRAAEIVDDWTVDFVALRRAYELVHDWTVDFVVSDKGCFEVDEEEDHIPHRPKRDLGPDAAKYVVAMQNLRDDVETLLQAPRDTLARNRVVFYLNKLNELYRSAKWILVYRWEFWNGGRWYNILEILQDMRRAVGIPVITRRY